MTTSATINILNARPTDFSSVSDWAQRKYNKFFEFTDENHINRYARGGSLTELADLASGARNVIDLCKCDLRGLDSGNQAQWELNRLSEIKERLSKAVALKKSYYTNNIFGIITQYVLKLFCMWNNGNTADVIKAEDFLLFWDSRRPVSKGSYSRKYHKRQDFSPSRINLDTSRYYNYNPSRLIELENGGKINYGRIQNTQ